MDANFRKDLIIAYKTVLGQEPRVEATQIVKAGVPVTALVVNGGLVVYQSNEPRPLKDLVRVTVGKLFPRTGVPELDEGNDETLTIAASGSEAIAAVVAEAAREMAQQAVEIEGMARTYGESD